ncbi:MAG TPA: hypothetical protein VGR98_02935, partial [Streptosporangiaceae bacterium]|nr:hypothetical protein [Streptosporangiaceae bacterium]
MAAVGWGEAAQADRTSLVLRGGGGHGDVLLWHVTGKDGARSQKVTGSFRFWTGRSRGGFQAAWPVWDGRAEAGLRRPAGERSAPNRVD